MTYRKSSLYRGSLLAGILVAGALVGCNQGGQGGEGGGGGETEEFVLPVGRTSSSLKGIARRRRLEARGRVRA